MRSARAVPLLQARHPLGIEPPDPRIDSRPGAAETGGDLPGGLALRGGEHDTSAIHEAGRSGPRPGELGNGALLLRCQGAQNDLGGHGCTSLRLMPVETCKSLAGCTTKWCIRQVI
jgi:hypothetical protein